MPDVRFGIDASAAQQGFSQLSGYLRTLGEQAKQTQAAVAGATGGGGAEAVAVRERAVRATRAQADASTQLLRVQQQQLRVGLTALSTLGEESRAYAQLTSWHIRRAQSMGQEINVGSLLAETRKRLAASDARAAEIFSVGAVRARDLRINMAGLNQSMAVIAATLTRINPALGATVSLMSRAGRAAGNLSGGFALLGPIVGILAAVTAGMGALAVAGDRAGRIPVALKGIWEGLKEVAARAGEATGATDLLVASLEKVQGLLPKTQTLDQRADQLRAEIAAASATPSAIGTAGRGTVEFGITGEAESRRRQLVELERQIVERNARAQRALLTAAESAAALDPLRKAEKERLEGIKATEEATKLASERTEEYASAIAKLREEEAQATQSEQERLSDLTVSNDLLVKEIAATRQGTEALKAFNVEKAVTLELERQRESGAALTDAESKALVAQVIQQQKLNDELKTTQDEIRSVEKANVQAAKEGARVWDNAIDNIQQGFGDLFTNLVFQGKDAFDDIGDIAKQMLSRIAGEFLNANVFGALFEGLRGATTGSGSGQFVQQAAVSSSVSQGTVSGLQKFFGGFGGGAAAGNGGGGGLLIVQGGINARIGRFDAAQSAASGIGSFSSVGGGGGGSNLNAVLGGIPIIGGIVGGTIAGRNFIKEMGLLREETTKLEKIAFNIGTILGGIAGGVLGGLAGGGIGGGAGAAGGAGGGLGAGGGAGIGAFLGSAIIGAIAVGQAQAIQQIFGLKGDTGGLFEAESRLQAENRAISIGLPIGLGYLLYNKVNRNIGITTGPTAEAVIARGLEGGRPVTRAGPFGVVGALGSLTGGDLPDDAVAQALETTIAIDRQLARFLTEEQEAIVRAMGDLPTIGTSNAKRLAEKLSGQRIQSILQRLGITDPSIISQFGVGTPQAQLDLASEILTTRKQMTDLVDAITGAADTATEAALAIEGLNANIDILADQGATFGVIIQDIEALRLQGLTRLTTEFDKTISDSILALTDPGTLASTQLTKLQEARLREAIAYSADLVEIERLTGLERVELARRLKDQDPLQSLLDQIRVTAVGQSPTTALLSAKTAFAEAEAAARGGSFAARGDLAQSAQALLGLSEQFLGGPGVATERDRIVAVLSELTLTMGGTAADTGAQLADLNSLTAAGNAANEQLLLRVIDRLAAIENENILLRESLERLNAA